METSEDQLESFYAALRNLDRLEHEDFREIIKSQFSPTLRERYLTVNYHRAAFNVEMMLAIKDTKQFQALSLLARAIFELALEVKSINLDPDAAQKIELFSKVELLRSARRLVAFKKKHPDAQLHYQTHEGFIVTCGQQIDAEAAAMWPASPVNGRRPKVKHWTTRTVLDRAIDMGAPFDRIYHVHYAELSWMTHSGVVSPLNMTSEWVTSFVGIVYSIAAESYMQILEILVNEFKLYITNPHLKKKIICNRDLGFTRTPEEGEAVMRKHGLWGYFESPRPWSSAQ
jgi:hypothetical protein